MKFDPSEYEISAATMNPTIGQVFAMSRNMYRIMEINEIQYNFGLSFRRCPLLYFCCMQLNHMVGTVLLVGHAGQFQKSILRHSERRVSQALLSHA